MEIVEQVKLVERESNFARKIKGTTVLTHFFSKKDANLNNVGKNHGIFGVVLVFLLYS